MVPSAASASGGGRGPPKQKCSQAKREKCSLLEENSSQRNGSCLGTRSWRPSPVDWRPSLLVTQKKIVFWLYFMCILFVVVARCVFHALVEAKPCCKLRRSTLPLGSKGKDSWTKDDMRRHVENKQTCDNSKVLFGRLFLFLSLLKTIRPFCLSFVG